MNKPTIFILTISLVFGWLMQQQGQTLTDETCTKSFHEFAYEGPGERKFTYISPKPPWVAELSSDNLSSDKLLHRTKLTRTIDGQTEIWISLSNGYWSYIIPISNSEREGFGIYNPETQDFEFVSHYVEDTELYVVNLFSTSDGTVWGDVYWDHLADYPNITVVPVLSKFNENTRQFEFAEGVLESPLIEHNRTEIVLDHQDIFWIFANDENLYRYDPVSQITEKQGNGIGGLVWDTAISSDNDIYFSLEEWTDDLMISEFGLRRFSTGTRQSEILDVPHGKWPLYSGLLIDSTGKLWLGAIGYRNTDNEWQMISPGYRRTYRRHLGQYMYAAPKVLMESSDGRIWFAKYLDSGGWGEGIAWYDPETNEGCLVTNGLSNVIEDDQARLWIAVRGVLYSYQLSE